LVRNGSAALAGSPPDKGIGLSDHAQTPPGALAAVAGRLSGSMVSLTFAFQVPYYARSEWTIERHHFEAQYGEPLETIDDDLVVIHARLDDLFDVIHERLDDLFGVIHERLDDLFGVIHERLDDLFDAVVRWTVYVFVRVSLGGPHHGIPSLLRGRCCGLEPKMMHSLVGHLTPVNSTSFDVQGTWERAPSSIRHGEALLAAKHP
jgi:hypothetical protein